MCRSCLMMVSETCSLPPDTAKVWPPIALHIGFPPYVSPQTGVVWGFKLLALVIVASQIARSVMALKLQYVHESPLSADRMPHKLSFSLKLFKQRLLLPKESNRRLCSCTRPHSHEDVLFQPCYYKLGYSNSGTSSSPWQT